MKKLLSLVLVLMVALSLAGAGVAETAAPLKVALCMSGAVNDQGWNQTAYEGALKACEKYGFDLSYTENLETADIAAAFADYAAAGYDVVIGHGYEFGDPALEVAENYPNVTFMHRGGRVRRQRRFLRHGLRADRVCGRHHRRQHDPVRQSRRHRPHSGRFAGEDHQRLRGRRAFREPRPRGGNRVDQLLCGYAAGQGSRHRHDRGRRGRHQALRQRAAATAPSAPRWTPASGARATPTTRARWLPYNILDSRCYNLDVVLDIAWAPSRRHLRGRRVQPGHGG